MDIFLIIISVFLIILVLLQSGKADSSSSIISGGNALFADRKERGGELFLTRLTAIFSIAFMILCILNV